MTPREKMLALAHEDLDAIARLLEDAEAVRFMPSRKPGRPDDAGVRSKGVHSDPTAETALDPVRMELSSAVAEAQGTLRAAYRSAERARRRLERALSAWAGHG